MITPDLVNAQRLEDASAAMMGVVEEEYVMTKKSHYQSHNNQRMDDMESNGHPSPINNIHQIVSQQQNHSISHLNNYDHSQIVRGAQDTKQSTF